MSTAEDEELLDEYDDDDEGIYEDEEDIYDDEGKVDHKNPVISREDEQAQVYEIKSGKERAGGNIVKSGDKKKLVAQMDKRGKWYVSIWQGNKQLTKWAPPTKAQAQKLDRKGKVVKGGVVDDDDRDDDDDDDGESVDLGEDEKRGIPWGKILVGTIVLGALGAGGYYAYKKIKSDDDAEVDEVED